MGFIFGVGLLVAFYMLTWPVAPVDSSPPPTVKRLSLTPLRSVVQVDFNAGEQEEVRGVDDTAVAREASNALALAAEAWPVSCVIPSSPRLVPLASAREVGSEWHFLSGEPSGEAFVYTMGSDASLGPTHILSWSSISGTCEINQIVEEVTLTGQIIAGDGPWPESVQCGTMTAAVAWDGSFSFEMPINFQCIVMARVDDWQAMASPHLTYPDHIELGPLLLDLDSTGAPGPSLETLLLGLAIDLEQNDMLFAAALDSDGLSQEAADLLDDWQTKEHVTYVSMLDSILSLSEDDNLDSGQF